jgi:beta-galactosidase GanA
MPCRYECAAMLAFGSKCSVGDQLHPDGVMSRDTYELIGAAYKEVEEKEPWCIDARPQSDIALLSPEAMHTGVLGEYRHKGASEEGASRMLLELGESFDVLDLEADFSPYKLLILPDEFVFDQSEAMQVLSEKLHKYLEGGGKILATGSSGLNAENTAFVLDLVRSWWGARSGTPTT